MFIEPTLLCRTCYSMIVQSKYMAHLSIAEAQSILLFLIVDTIVKGPDTDNHATRKRPSPRYYCARRDSFDIEPTIIGTCRVCVPFFSMPALTSKPASFGRMLETMFSCFFKKKAAVLMLCQCYFWMLFLWRRSENQPEPSWVRHPQE
jgi:hypothetical protein